MPDKQFQMIPCPTCGKPVPENSRACAYCGLQVVERKAPFQIPTIVFVMLFVFGTCTVLLGVVIDSIVVVIAGVLIGVAFVVSLLVNFVLSPP